MGGLKRILKSSKAQVAFGGILAAVGTHFLGLDPAVADKLSIQITVIIVTLIGGIAYEDNGAKKNGNGGAE